MPVRGRQGSMTLLQMGAGPQFLAIAPVANGAAPSITHYCLGVDGFNVDRALAALAAHGVTKADAIGPMKALIESRGPDMNGAKEGTAELSFGDPDGIVCQLQDAGYCGGAGAIGNGLRRAGARAERAARAARLQPPDDLFAPTRRARTSSIRICSASRSARIRDRPRRRSRSVRPWSS